MRRGLFLVYGLATWSVVPATFSMAESVFATAAKVEGAVTFTVPDTGLVRMMPAGARVAGGMVVTSGAGGYAELQLTPCSALELTPETALRLDDLQLVRRGDGIVSRAAEMTVSSGSANFIIEGLVTRINLPGLLLTAQHAAFGVRIKPDGGTSVILFSGMATLTDSRGKAVELRGGTFAIGALAGVGDQQTVRGDLAAEAVLSSVIAFLDKAYFLSLVCEDTLIRMRGEYLRLPERIVQAEEERGRRGMRRPAVRTVVSPEQ